MISFPNKKYKTIYADPPWDVSLFSRYVRPFQLPHPYSKMKLQDIKKLPVQDISDEQCHLYLWTTHKYLPEAFNVMKSWGFNYHCCITWDKTFGFTPFSFMRSTEYCLFGQKPNKWLKLKKLGEKTLITEKPTKHSKKPKAMYELIEKVSYKPRIELFARNKRIGWDSWGDEL